MIEFTFLETQLIRSSLASKNDQELADLLERPVDEVRDKINEITGGGASDRAKLIDTARNQVAEQKKQRDENKRRERERKILEKQEDVKKRHEQKKIAKTNAELEKKQRPKTGSNKIQPGQVSTADRKRQKTEWENRKKYKTREINYSELRSVQVGKGTYVFVPATISDEQARANYKNEYTDKRPEWAKKLDQFT